MKKLQRASSALAAALCLINLSTGSVFAQDSQAISPPVAGATDPLTIRKAFRLESDPLVSIIQKDAPVEQVLRGLAQKANLNLIFMGGNGGDSVTSSAAGTSASKPVEEDPLAALQDATSATSTPASTIPTITSMTIPFLELKNVPVSEAFALVLQMSGLVGRRVYNSLLITTPEQMTKMGFSAPIIKTYRIYNQASTVAVSTGTSTTTAGAGAADSPIITQLQTVFKTRGLNPEPKLMLDARTSTLIVIGTQEAIDLADKLVPVLDQALPQVVVEVKLIELTKSASQELGLTYGFGQGKVGGAFNNTFSTGVGDPITAPGQTGITFSSLSNFAPNFNVRLNALIQDRQARVLTSPRLTIQHGFKATFDSTTQFPISSTTATATTVTQTITSLDIGEKLDITPFIDTEKNMVTMKLKPEISTRGSVVQVGAQTVPEKNIRTLETILAVPDGESVIIGGLMRKNDTENVSKLPLLGDIPVLGALFSTTQKTQEDVEIVIMVTPHILQTQ